MNRTVVSIREYFSAFEKDIREDSPRNFSVNDNVDVVALELCLDAFGAVRECNFGFSDHIVAEQTDICRFWINNRIAVFGFAEEQDVFEETGELPDAHFDVAEILILLLFRPTRPSFEQLCIGENRRERGSEFVGNHLDEVGFYFIQLSFFFEGNHRILLRLTMFGNIHECADEDSFYRCFYK